ncbi:MAG: ROK family protein [Bacteroidales bacterium]|nr:ROK family protein [Bacteroidales bacterium]
MNKQLLENPVISNGLSNIELKKIFQKNAIIEYLYQLGPTSNPEIARYTKMSSPTITKLIQELIELGIVIDVGIGDSIGGRRPNLFGINPNARYIVGIDIDCRMVKLGIFNLANEAVSEIITYFGNVKDKNEMFSELFNRLDGLIEESDLDKKAFLGIGVSIPGLINSKTGQTYMDLRIEGKKLEDHFRDRYELPVIIDSDSRVMAIGEQAFGYAKNKKDVLCLNICDGIGLGMILNGIVYRGKSGLAGEFGHINVVRDGNLCTCGKYGCLETVASGTALIEQAQQGIKKGQESLISELVNNDLENIHVSDIIKAVNQGDIFAIEIINKLGHFLGEALASLVHIFNPEMIIIGGKVALAEDYLINPIQNTLNKYTISHIKKDTEVVTSRLEEKVKLLGSVAMVMNQVFDEQVEEIKFL